MKQISVWSRKGGVGKSILSVNLAGYAFKNGLVPIIVDLDEQRTCMYIASKGKLPFTVVDEIPSKRPNCDVIIFDHPNSAAAKLYGTVIVPFRPVSSDFASVSKNFAGIEERGHNLVKVVSQGDPRVKDQRLRVASLQAQFDALKWSYRAAVQKAWSEFMPILHPKVRRKTPVLDAEFELELIFKKAVGDA